MKRIFTIIIILISISLIGIIVIQLSWLRNMILLTESGIKARVSQAVIKVGEELREYKGNYTATARTVSPNNPFQEDFSLDFIRPVTLGKRFSAAELNDKIKTVFRSLDLKNLHFEFALSTTSRGGMADRIERQSQNFINEYDEIYTTRLHGYILSVLLDKKVNLIDNSYGKNSTFYNTWMKEFENSSMIN